MPSRWACKNLEKSSPRSRRSVAVVSIEIGRGSSTMCVHAVILFNPHSSAEPIGSRQQCRISFPLDQKIKSLLIALGQLQYQICPDTKLRPFAESFCYRRISRRALSTNNSLSLEVTDLS